MSILRTIECDVCHKTETETAPNAGWQNWGSIFGIVLNGVDTPNLCAECLMKTADFVDKMAGG
jgi:hypothetical protein